MQAKQLTLLLIFLLLILSSTVFAQISAKQDIQFGIDIMRSWLGLIIMGLIALATVVYIIGHIIGSETKARATVWSQNLLIGCFFALLLYTVFPSAAAAFITGEFRYAELIMICLSFSVGIIVMFYLVATFFQHAPLQAAVKEDIGAFIVTLLIVIFWNVISEFLSDIVGALIVGVGPLPSSQVLTVSHADAAYGALEIFFVKLRSNYFHLYLFEVLIGFLSTVSFPIGSPLPAVNIISFSLMPFDGLNLLSNAHTVVVEAIGYLMATIWAKEFIVIFARDTVPLILFPLGIVMRSFVWFRATGSSLIAISAALYFVYPLTVLLSNYLIFDVYQPRDFVFTPDEKVISFFKSGQEKTEAQIDLEKEHALETGEDFREQFKSENSIIEQSITIACPGDLIDRMICSVSKLISASWEGVKGFISTVFKIWTTMVSFSGDLLLSVLFGVVPAGATAGLYRFVVQEVIAISQFVILVTVASVIEIIITVTLYRNISELLGGELEIAGLTKLV